VLENCEDLFGDAVYDGIYRDDGLVIMNGLKTNEEISQWLETFQERVNQVTGYEGLVFTVSIWRQGGDVKPTHPKAEIHKSSVFPFLDMKMSWSEEGELRFGVYLKPGQQLKYLNNISTYPQPPLLQSNHQRCLRTSRQPHLAEGRVQVQVYQRHIP
jgi:hypothetical protein